MKFSDIPGHDSVKRRLRQMADSGRLPHALMLQGEPGIGKMALARALAQYIHCTAHTPDGDSCGECPSCRQHQSFNHIDTFFSFPVSKKESGRTITSDDYMSEWHDYLSRHTFMNFTAWHAMLGNKASQPLIPRDEARSLLRKVSTTSHASDKQIVIVWLPERMHETAANALLKLIEEPFADTDFIFVSDAPQQLLPTIRSRCQAVEVARLSDADIAAYISRHNGLDPQDAAAVAHLAEGSVSKALALVDADGGDNRRFLDMFVSLMRLAYQRDVARLRAWANDLTALGREPSMNFYAFAQRLIRENFMYNFHEPQLVYMNRDEENFSVRFSRFITERNAPRLVEAMNAAMTDIAGNGNGKIVNFDLAIRTILLLK